MIELIYNEEEEFAGETQMLPEPKNRKQIGEPGSFKKIFIETESDVVRTLAINGFGSLYAEEIIERANEITEINKNTSNEDLTSEQLSALYKSLNDLFDILKNEEYKPQIVKDGRKEDVLPMDLVKYEGFEKTYYENFNEACDEFYSKKVNSDIKDVKERAWNKKVNKFEKC